MSYRIEAGEIVEDAVRRIAGEQIDKAVGEIDDSDLSEEKTIHQVRKRCKKIRGLLRLARKSFEDTYRAENAHFRDLARELSELRDQTSRIECLDRLELADDEDFAPHLAAVRRLLADERDDFYASEDVSERLGRVRDGLEDANGRRGGWTLADEGFDALVGGLKKTYRRGQKAMRDAVDEGTVEAFHEWRKRVKYHRYHVRLLAPAWTPVLEARREALEELSNFLGDAHDLAVLRRWLFDRSERLPSVVVAQRIAGLADHCRMELRARALPRGRRLYVETPGALTKRAGAFWASWRTEVELLRTRSSAC
jgi:CHAD domain-containing protein